MKIQALLIIDMQKGLFTPATPRHDAQGVVMRINALAVLLRERAMPVIYIQHNGKRDGDFLLQSEDWQLLDELKVEPSDIMLSKTANDAFYRTELETILRKLNVDELLITGCATDFCVESTLQSALVKDFDVIAVADGHTTADRPHLTAEQVIGHHNYLWADLIATRGKVSVQSFKQISGFLTA